jgi:hypothetical protein
MTMARAHLVDPAVTRWYHCVTRCVRRAFLLGEGPNDRKLWIENRLRELAEIFAVSVAGFSVLDNLLRI